MNYGKIYYADMANGIGIRTSLFVSGCRHHCKGCFNEDTWSFDYGQPFTKAVEDQVIVSISAPYVDGIAVLGGEPMEPENQEGLLNLFRRIRSECPDKTVWVYSGYLWEELTDPKNRRCHGPHTDEILSLIDVLVDGPFVLEKKDIALRFRGSDNQRIIDVRQTLQTGTIVLSEYMN